ncbi:lysophospholipid acyltransferase family protein [Coraliomargarita parva]|uniref:lysophospholipid acyltransferase family protein n=1 Tax=Coraliomargarita parva TaxID=3014050 RepID=UPI0022B364D5|nr:lysophospholipid acyltransferase family protein [Coraliomargarita parva]
MHSESALNEAGQLIDLKGILRQQGCPEAFVGVADFFLGHLLSVRPINRHYPRFLRELRKSKDVGEGNFFMSVLKYMGIQFEIDADAYAKIPKEGPLLVVANHPYGGIDGVVLGAMLQGLRPDSKVMGNYLLGLIPGLKEHIVEVDPFEAEHSMASNITGMRRALDHLKDGGCLGVFPSGEVSSYKKDCRGVADREWSKHVVNLALRSNSKVLPVYFHGSNGFVFQLLGLIHPRLRTLMLSREFYHARGQTLKVNIGEPIAPDYLTRFDSRKLATDFLRAKTYELGQRTAVHGMRFPFRQLGGHSHVALSPLAPPQLKHRLRNEVEALPDRHCLARQKHFAVYYAKAAKIPTVLLEIGRLREETFRAVEEGTGQARDLDVFDSYYTHLFMWDHRNDAIVGAYRVAIVEDVVRSHGIAGLYTNTLFRYQSGFIRKLGPAAELGRSFVCLQYQRKHASLALIWRGIGEFMALHPGCRTLFGPVSITSAYNRISKDLMVSFFREHNFDDELSSYVRPRNPPKTRKRIPGMSLKRIGESLKSIDAISAIISGFEEDKKGIPMLLRHYLKLNGVLVSFNVDPAFSDVIDGLILVDVTKSDKRLLERYFGKDAYGDIMKHLPAEVDQPELQEESVLS